MAGHALDYDFTTLEDQLSRSLTLMRSIATLSGFFGALAVILATIGLYGIMAYNVARRRNEIGVRIALGAERSRVIRLVLREVATIVLAGVAIGMGLSLGLARLAVAFLYGVAPWDVATFASAAVVLVVPVALLKFRRSSAARTVLERSTYVSKALPGVVVALSLVFFATRYAYHNLCYDHHPTQAAKKAYHLGYQR